MAPGHSVLGRVWEGFCAAPDLSLGFSPCRGPFCRRGFYKKKERPSRGAPLLFAFVLLHVGADQGLDVTALVFLLIQVLDNVGVG